MSRFRPGERVRVGELERRGHVRTPWYVRGRSGIIERVCGEFRNPESLAYGGDGLPKVPLYRVRFPSRELWADYAGPTGDSVDVEIYEHWLEPVRQPKSD